MTIGNILSGFRATGVYPFNLNKILDKLLKPKGIGQTHITASNVEFTADTIKKFEKRFENGYNIYTNQTYVQWLRIHHPDHLPTD